MLNWADDEVEHDPLQEKRTDSLSRVPHVGDEINLADGDGRYRVVRVNSKALRCQVVDLMDPGRKRWVSCTRVKGKA